MLLSPACDGPLGLSERQTIRDYQFLATSGLAYNARLHHYQAWRPRLNDRSPIIMVSSAGLGDLVSTFLAGHSWFDISILSQINRVKIVAISTWETMWLWISFGYRTTSVYWCDHYISVILARLKSSENFMGRSSNNYHDTVQRGDCVTYNRTPPISHVISNKKIHNLWNTTKT